MSRSFNDFHNDHHNEWTLHRGHGINPDRCAPDCDDQLPTISRVGRGLTGNSYRVGIKYDDSDETYLQGQYYDAAKKQWVTPMDWVSENVNGGELHYRYNLMPYSVPQTFTITFIYRRPGRTEWSWTTPPIPYLWDVDGDGEPDIDGIIGSGIANLYVRTGPDKPWLDTPRHGTEVAPNTVNDGRWGQLNWPPGDGPKDFNSPRPTEMWAASLTFGIGGDIELPSIDDLAKILGVSVENIRNIIKNVAGQFGGSDNVKDYVDDLNTHIHSDMGFGGPGSGGSLIGCTPGSVIPAATLPLPVPSAGQPYTIKNYVDYKMGQLQKQITDQGNVITNLNNTLADILQKFYGGGTINPDGTITWPTTGKAAVGNINVISGATNSTAGLFTHVGTANNDVDFA